MSLAMIAMNHQRLCFPRVSGDEPPYYRMWDRGPEVFPA